MATVQDILAVKGAHVQSIGPDATVLDAALLMNEHRIGSLVVLDGGQLVGIVTERDILQRVVAQRRDPADTHVRDVMTGEVIYGRPHTPLDERLEEIYDGLSEIIKETSPEVMSIEKLFFARNVTTAMSVSHARGVAMLTGRKAKLPIAEYTPMEIKQTLTGYGKADKKQMQEMVRLQLNLKEIPRPDDAADALAAAITYAMMSKTTH